jgi:hypothetical protein
MSAQSADELWIGSVERYHERAKAERREQWIDFHRCMSELHARLSQEHAAKAEALCCADTDPAPAREARTGAPLTYSPPSMCTTEGRYKA